MTNKRSLTYEYIYEFIQKNNCELISKEYFGNRYKIEIKFECGHVGTITFSDFHNGIRCGMCRYKNAGKYHAYTKEKIIEVFEKSEFILIRIIGEKISNKTIIEYKCKFGHINKKSMKSFAINKNCPTCSAIKRGFENSGRNSPGWKGGISDINEFCRTYIKEWKKNSAKSCDYKCIITGEAFDEIHHLIPYSDIMKEVLFELNLEIKKLALEYSENELNFIKLKIEEIHKKYPLGVCLTRDVHKLFHKYYGKINNTPAQFEEFKSRIASGEIVI